MRIINALRTLSPSPSFFSTSLGERLSKAQHGWSYQSIANSPNMGVSVAANSQPPSLFWYSSLFGQFSQSGANTARKFAQAASPGYSSRNTWILLIAGTVVSCRLLLSRFGPHHQRLPPNAEFGSLQLAIPQFMCAFRAPRIDLNLRPTTWSYSCASELNQLVLAWLPGISLQFLLSAQADEHSDIIPV